MTYNGQESDKLDREFNAEVIDTTFNSATVKWNLLRDAEVYKVEKHHKYKGWEKTGWTSTDNYVIHDLEENFGYLLRVQALKCDESKSHYAIINTSPEIVACTLADLPSTLALHRALKKSQQFLVKRLLRRRPNLIEYPGPNGYLPLCNAIAYGETCIADYLLTIGASVHIGNLDNKRTPLHVSNTNRKIFNINSNFSAELSALSRLLSCTYIITNSSSDYCVH
ncbi:ankyrin repeat and SAM domain-containing protein flippy isoform 1-T1 [Glossina fuscipes fuscipes]